MNERIRELWSQADGNYDGGNQHTWPQYTIDNPEKFAELIVQECINIVQYEANAYHEPAWPYEIINDIKERFGVE